MADAMALGRLAAALHDRPNGALVGWRDGQRIDNAWFVARMWRWCDLLRQQPGDHYALYLDDSLEFGAALLGAWQAGKTVWLAGDTLDASCAALRGRVDGFLGTFPAAFAPLAPPDEVMSPGHAPRTARIIDEAFAALVVFTSGSTGAAQAIPKKLSQLASETATLHALFGGPDESADHISVLATVSHQHIYGLLFKVLWPLTAGRAIHALSISYPEQMAAALAGAGPCVLVTSPAHLKRLPEHLDWQGARASLRTVFSSGGPLALETAQASGRLLGQVPVEVYGSSETGGVAWRRRVAGSDESWLAFPGVAWRLAGDESAPARQLEVRSAHLADDGWLRLADRATGMAAINGEARFLLLGRSDRIVKIEEKRISLDAIEAALAASPLVAEARVALCDPVPGERQKLAAFVVPSHTGNTLLAAEGKQALNLRLRAALAGTVESVALPRRWRYVDSLPVNAQGKVTQAGLMALLAPRDAMPPAPPVLPHVRTLESAPGRVLLELTAPANLLYFQGHFDVAPILPGVAQVEWAIRYGRQHFALPAAFGGINALKFQHVIRPDMPVHLELVHDTLKHSLNFRYLSDSSQHSSGRIQFHDGAADD